MRSLIIAIAMALTCMAAGAVDAVERLTAKSWLVADQSGTIVKGENTEAVRSIASITKLFTAMVVLDAHQDLDEHLVFRTYRDPKKSKNKHKEKPNSQEFTRRQLLDMALVRSDNHAADVLCNNYPGGTTACITAMQAKAVSMGMMHTSLFEPTGLDQRNVSTARDLILLVRHARSYPVIVEAGSQAKVEIKINKKWLFFKNTNPMIGKDRRIVVSKTGFINAAGGCIVLGLDTDKGQRTVVVLGSKNTHTRIPEAEFIADMER